MNLIAKSVELFSVNAREKRRMIFLQNFNIDKNTKILDLGSGDGSNIKSVLRDADISVENICIADIDKETVVNGKEMYGFTPVIIDESGTIPFGDKVFDIVYCSSVIEHVTVPKNKVWSLYSGRQFKREAQKRQKELALEIQRLGKTYFVQTPYKYFPIESHTWLPFIFLMPRWLLVLMLHITNVLWIKKTSPDWYLLNEREMSMLFDEAQIIREKAFGVTKSIMAVSSHHE